MLRPFYVDFPPIKKGLNVERIALKRFQKTAGGKMRKVRALPGQHQDRRFGHWWNGVPRRIVVRQKTGRLVLLELLADPRTSLFAWTEAGGFATARF